MIAYNSLTSVRMNFEQIEQYIKDARDLIAQKATLKDVATIRENANEQIQRIVLMSKATKTKSRLSTTHHEFKLKAD